MFPGRGHCSYAWRSAVDATANWLVNGDFEATPAFTYFDGFDPSMANDVPGWTMFRRRRGWLLRARAMA